MKAPQDKLRFLDNPSPEVAPRLLGCLLTRTLPEGSATVRIVETEAYDQTDPASHSFRGPTARTHVMFGPSGFLYVYFTYGMHYCANIVTGPAGQGAAVLIRAVEPVSGIALMERLRPGRPGSVLTNGPAKFCQALAIDRSLNGQDLRLAPLVLTVSDALGPGDLVQTTRIGIRHAIDRPWRFYIKGNPYVSRNEVPSRLPL